MVPQAHESTYLSAWASVCFHNRALGVSVRRSQWTTNFLAKLICLLGYRYHSARCAHRFLLCCIVLKSEMPLVCRLAPHSMALVD